MNSVSAPLVLTYCLEPGDCTRYTFSVSVYERPFLQDGDPSKRISLGYAIPGIGDGSEYVGITIQMEGGGTGFFFLHLGALAAISEHKDYSCIAYASSKVKGVDPYSLAAIILAVSRLTENPKDLGEACKAMMEVPNIEALVSWISRMRGHQEEDDD